MLHSDDANPSVMSTDLPTGVYLLDVREDDEWAAGHAPDAVHIPVGTLSEHADEIPQDREVYVICRSGARSAYAAQALAEKIAHNSPAAMAATKRALWGALEPWSTLRFRWSASSGRRAPPCRERPAALQKRPKRPAEPMGATRIRGNRPDVRPGDSVERTSDLVRAAGFEGDKLHAEVARRARELGAGRDRGRVGQDGDPLRPRDEFMQDFEPLHVQLRSENAHPGRIAVGTGKRMHQSRPHHVVGDADDGYRHGRLLGGAKGRVPGAHDDIDLGFDQFCRHFWKLLDAECPAASCDHEVLDDR